MELSSIRVASFARIFSHIVLLAERLDLRFRKQTRDNNREIAQINLINQLARVPFYTILYMSLNFQFKKHLIEQLKKKLIDDISLYEKSLSDLEEDISNETKSSAGDKFETSREMMQQERQKTESQLQRLNKTINQLEQIGTDEFQQVESGALIRSGNIHIFFFSGLSNITIDGVKVYVSALDSPVGKKLKGLKTGMEETVNGKMFHIDEVC